MRTTHIVCRVAPLLASAAMAVFMAGCETEDQKGSPPVPTPLAGTHEVQPANPASQGTPVNEADTTAAWEALNAGHYEEAIKQAQLCLEAFRDAANKLQADLENTHAVIPDGAVNQDEKQRIFKNGLLNDVATCYFIKGSAAERLGRTEEAKAAYSEATRLTYARTWDPKGWFWRPAVGAAERLKGLK